MLVKYLFLFENNLFINSVIYVITINILNIFIQLSNNYEIPTNVLIMNKYVT